MGNDVEKYCIDHSNLETELQIKIKEYTFKNEKYPQMISGPIVTNFLSALYPNKYIFNANGLGCFVAVLVSITCPSITCNCPSSSNCSS